MPYKKIYEMLTRELYSNGFAGNGRMHQIEISIIYNALFDNREMSSYANQVIKDAKIDKTFLKNFKNEIKLLDEPDISNLILLVNEGMHTFGYYDINNELISSLAIRLLDPQYGDVILDFGCSYGSFLSYVKHYCDLNKIELMMYNGVDLNSSLTNEAKMVLEIIKAPHNISVGDYLIEELPSFTKGFVFPPLGRYLDKHDKTKSLVFPEITFPNNSSGWNFVDRMLPFVNNDKTRIVTLLPHSALFNHQCEDYRKRLLNNGYIEGIIELPSGVLNNTGVVLDIVVLSKGNKYVKFIKVEGNYDSKKTKSINKRIDIEKIINDYNDKKHDYLPISEINSLHTLQYSTAVNTIETVKDGRKLGEVADVFSGAQYTISKFKDSISSKPTKRQIVVSSDIEDGIVDWRTLPYIEGFEHFDKYKIQKGDLIITSKSSKVKIAYVDIESNTNIIVTGGMLIVRPKKDLDGAFLKIFLSSEDGEATLKSIQKGSIITSMNARDLKEITIPVPPLKQQEELSKKYNNTLTTLVALKEEIKKLENQLRDFYKKEVTK